MSQQNFPYFRSTLISFGYFTNNLTWSAYNVFVPLFLSQNLEVMLGETPVINTLVGLIMVLDNISSILIQPVIGQMSDRTWVPKLGRRMPFVIIGLPLAAFFFGLIGSFQSTFWVLMVAITGFNISMAFYRSPVMSLVPDMLPKDFRSQGAGVLNVVGGIASITSLLLTSYLIEINSPFAFWANSIMMIGCLIILLLSVREKKDIDIEKTEHQRVGLISAFKNLIKGRNLILILMLGSVFFHIAGYNIAETFISRYVTELLGFPKQTAGFILGAFVGFSIIAALPAGLVGKKIGALNACIVGVIGFTISMIPLTIISLLPNLTIIKSILTLNTLTGNFWSWELPFYLLLIFLMGFSWLLLSINSIVVIWNISPKKQTATYTSYFYVFVHLAAILSPFIAGGIFDLYEYTALQAGLEVSGLRIMFVYMLVCFIITMGFLVAVKILRNKELKEIEDKEKYLEKVVKQKEYPLLYIPTLLFGIGVRQDKELIELREEQIKERRELRRKIRKIKQNRRKLRRRVFSDIDDLVNLQVQELKEYMKLRKEMKKEHKDQRKELKQEILEDKILKKRTEEKEEREKEEKDEQKKNSQKV